MAKPATAMAKPSLAQQSPISAPRVAQKIKRQHHRIDERLQGLGCAVVVVRSATTTRFLGASVVFGGKEVG